jgi:D-alanyl-D-alanine-carboxypeptidase/D-alanyl-D-alanine-endopeptidase
MRLLLTSLLLFGLLPAAGQTAPEIKLHDLNEAEALGSEIYTDSGATGLVLVVVRGNEVFFQGYGETAPGSHTAPTKYSVVRLCSLTKIFTADVLAQLAANGVVRLDDPLEKYAPLGSEVPERGAPITLEELATHTAGLDREVGTAPRHTPHFTYPDFDTRWNWLAHTELKYTPGTQALYSNVGFDLLSDALARAAQTSYPALLETRTLEPLKMWETTFYPSAEQCARLLQGAHNEGPCTATENTMGSSGLYSTPEDVAKWLRYLVGDGAPALPVQADAAHAVYLLASSLTSTSGLSHAGRPSGIGLGWMHLGANDDISHIIEKTGGGAGFTTYIAIHPASHTALFVAATDGPPDAGTRGFRLFQAANDALLALADLPPRPRQTVRSIAPRRIPRGTLLARTQEPRRRKRPVRVAQKKTVAPELSRPLRGSVN